MRDYYVHSENITEIELIIDHVHESREANELFHESREYFRSRITGNNSFFHDSRQLKIGIHGSRKNPFPTLLYVADGNQWPRKDDVNGVY